MKHYESHEIVLDRTDLETLADPNEVGISLEIKQDVEVRLDCDPTNTLPEYELEDDDV